MRIHARLPVAKGDKGQPDVGRTIAGAGPLVEIGVTDLQLASVPYLAGPDDLEQFFADVAKAWQQRAVSG
jgi:hypothetical protein